MNSKELSKEFLKAKLLFLEGSYSNTEIGSILGISSKSVYRWAKKYKWVTIRPTYTYLFDDIVSIATKEIISIHLEAAKSGRFINAEEVVVISNLVNVIRDINLEFSNPLIFGVLNDFEKFIVKEQPDLIMSFKKFKTRYATSRVDYQKTEESMLNSINVFPYYNPNQSTPLSTV